jgi:hypothetical protein
LEKASQRIIVEKIGTVVEEVNIIFYLYFPVTFLSFLAIVFLIMTWFKLPQKSSDDSITAYSNDVQCSAVQYSASVQLLFFRTATSQLAVSVSFENYLSQYSVISILVFVSQVGDFTNSSMSAEEEKAR